MVAACYRPAVMWWPRHAMRWRRSCAGSPCDATRCQRMPCRRGCRAIGCHAMLPATMPASCAMPASDASPSPAATISRQECFTNVSRLAMVIAVGHRDYIAKGMFHGCRVYRKRRNLQEFGKSSCLLDAELLQGFRRLDNVSRGENVEKCKRWLNFSALIGGDSCG